MAYAVLRSLRETIGRVLNHDEFPISVNGKQQLASLREMVNFFLEFIEKSPLGRYSFLDTRIRDAANEAEDVIEHFMYEEIHKPNTTSEYELGELEMVMEEFKSIAKETMNISSNMLLPEDGQEMQSETSSPEDSIVGLKDDLEKVKELVVIGESTKRRLITITGMGGIGKTTLARKVYEDKLLKDKFRVRAWVSVSQDYDLKIIATKLLYDLQRVVGEGTADSNDSAGDKVCQILMVRRYLIVLDDLWSPMALKDIMTILLPDNDNGSRIVITTRMEYVASDADLHKMGCMDPENSWKLLKQHVFPDRECPIYLEKMGKDIAKRCAGLPLAIVLIAGMLSKVKEGPDSWEEFAKDVRSLIQRDARFQKTMSKSYTNLPHHLRPCLLYMAGLPEDCEIRISKLIKLWIAEGFVKRNDDGEDYLRALAQRGLASVTAVKSNGLVKSCSIHNLVRDMCETIALDENFERRLSIAHPDLRCHAKAYGSTLRSVICFRQTETSLGGVRKLRLLRVLDAVDADAYSLPPQVFDLFHLMHLAFSCRIKIPAAISRLQNLRTLIIRPSKKLRHYSTDEVYLPLEIWKLPLLTHLVSFFDLLPDPNGGAFAALENLLTLIVVKKLICTREMMVMIPNVSKLGITYFGDKYKEDYQLQNLVLLHQLEKLTLVLRKGPLVGITVNPVFPQTLKKLTLSGWRLPWEVMGTIGSLPRLQVLKLRDHACQGGKWETDEEQFRSLEYLLIDESDLKEWVTDGGHFPKLKRLVIYRCFLLSEIPDEIGDVPALELIEVDNMNWFLMMSVKKLQEEQEGEGNNLLKARFV